MTERRTKNLGINQSIQLGIQVIYQDMSIFPNLTAAENIALNYELYNRKKIVNWKNVYEGPGNRFGISESIFPWMPRSAPRPLPISVLIAIARSILHNSRLIIMDEPTSALTRKEVDKLFRVIRQLQGRGSRSCSSATSWTRCLRLRISLPYSETAGILFPILPGISIMTSLFII